MESDLEGHTTENINKIENVHSSPNNLDIAPFFNSKNLVSLLNNVIDNNSAKKEMIVLPKELKRENKQHGKLPKITIGFATSLLAFVFLFPDTFSTHPYIGPILNNDFFIYMWLIALLNVCILCLVTYYAERLSNEIIDYLFSNEFHLSLFRNLYDSCKKENDNFSDVIVDEKIRNEVEHLCEKKGNIRITFKVTDIVRLLYTFLFNTVFAVTVLLFLNIYAYTASDIPLFISFSYVIIIGVTIPFMLGRLSLPLTKSYISKEVIESSRRLFIKKYMELGILYNNTQEITIDKLMTTGSTEHYKFIE